MTYATAIGAGGAQAARFVFGRNRRRRRARRVAVVMMTLQSDRGPIHALASLGGLGLLFGLYTALGTLIGYYLDEKWGTSPWLLISGMLLGIGAGFFEVITLAKRVARENSGGQGRHGDAAHRDG
jgi:hypothetical protein